MFDIVNRSIQLSIQFFILKMIHWWYTGVHIFYSLFMLLYMSIINRFFFLINDKTRTTGNTRAFTLVEMIVVITILSILSLIGYVSYSDSVVGARDSQRINDLEKLQIDLKSHKQKEGSYPLPINSMNITNSGTVVYQGTLTSATVSNVLQNIPKDPRSNNWYWYSTTTNRQQFQMALTIENDDSPKALVKGDYKSIIKDLFPTLLLSVTGAASFDANSGAIANKFILNGGSYNLPYDMKGVIVANADLNLASIQSEL